MTTKIKPDNVAKDWFTLPFFPSPVERFIARYWVICLLLLYLSLLIPGFVAPFRFNGEVVPSWRLMLDAFITTLFGACFLAGISIRLWEGTLRKTFGNARRDGLIRDDEESRKEFAVLTDKFAARIASKWRYVAFGLMICFVIVANRLQVFSIIGCARNFRSACSISGNGMADFVTNVTVILIQILIAYAGAVIGWNLITNAIWISKFSKSSCLHLQPGHSDNSCGLANVGLCCLQSALPLAIGMLLCLLWANGHRLAWFEGHINPGFLDFLKNYVYSLLIALFGLACAQVFLPVMSLHKRMQDYKREHDREYSKLVRSQYEISLHTLPTSDEQKIKYLSDRLKVIQFLDPVALRLGTWPFDRAALVSYGISPVLTLVAALLKKLS